MILVGMEAGADLQGYSYMAFGGLAVGFGVFEWAAGQLIGLFMDVASDVRKIREKAEKM